MDALDGHVTNLMLYIKNSKMSKWACEGARYELKV